MMTVEDHVREVLARGNGWLLRGVWPALEVHSDDYPGGPVGAHVVVYDPNTDTWGRTYITPGTPMDLPPEELSRQVWTLGYYSAAAAAEEVEQVVSLTAAARA